MPTSSGSGTSRLAVPHRAEVGDEKQLPATVLHPRARDEGLGISLFERASQRSFWKRWARSLDGMKASRQTHGLSMCISQSGDRRLSKHQQNDFEIRTFSSTLAQRRFVKDNIVSHGLDPSDCAKIVLVNRCLMCIYVYVCSNLHVACVCKFSQELPTCLTAHFGSSARLCGEHSTSRQKNTYITTLRAEKVLQIL